MPRIAPGRYTKGPVTAIEIPFAFGMKVEGRTKDFEARCWLIENDDEPGKAYVLPGPRFIAIYLNGEPPLPGEVPG